MYYILLCVYKTIRWSLYQFMLPFVRMRVYKVIKYDKEVTDKSEDVTSTYCSGNIPRISDDEYLEYRVMFKDFQYRVISTNDAPKDPSMAMFQRRIRSPLLYPKIVSATLRNKQTKIETDVYDRLMKYAGPNQDFFGSTLKMKWLFVNDDLDCIDSHLVILFTNSQTKVFELNETI